MVNCELIRYLARAVNLSSLSSSEGERGRCLLNIGVQGFEAAMGGSESRGVVRFAADDLDVAR